MDPSFDYSDVNVYSEVITEARKVERDYDAEWREDQLEREIVGDRC